MAASRFLIARFRKNELDHHRFSTIVSTKIERRAVVRNRIRRQIYEIIRLHLEKIAGTAHFDILILPKKAIIGTTYDDLEKSFSKLLPHIQ